MDGTQRTRLVFLDVDGTLIDSRQQVPESARAACLAARKRGHRLFLCTGRSLPEIYPWLWDLGIEGLVGSGGGYGQIGDRPVFDDRAPHGDVAFAVSWLDGAGAQWIWQSADGLWCSPGFLDAFLGRGGEHGASGEWSAYERQVAPSLHPGTPGDASKCTFILPPGSPAALSDAAEAFRGRFHVIPGSVTMERAQHAEMVPQGVSKGTGLIRIASLLGVPVERTIAIGDSANDLDMLRAAGVGVAMGNGRPAVKDVADLVTAPIDQDGLARAFEDLGLI